METIGLVVPVDRLGAVIGKAGSGLKYAREQSGGCKLEVVQHEPNAPSRRVNLNGDAGQVAAAFAIIVQKAYPDETYGIPTILVPADRAGGIVGKGGEMLKRVREVTGVQVKVEREAIADPDTGIQERMVTLQGDLGSVGTALGIALGGSGRSVGHSTPIGSSGNGSMGVGPPVGCAGLAGVAAAGAAAAAAAGAMGAPGGSVAAGSMPDYASALPATVPGMPPAAMGCPAGAYGCGGASIQDWATALPATVPGMPAAATAQMSCGPIGAIGAIQPLPSMNDLGALPAVVPGMPGMPGGQVQDYAAALPASVPGMPVGVGGMQGGFFGQGGYEGQGGGSFGGAGYDGGANAPSVALSNVRLPSSEPDSIQLHMYVPDKLVGAIVGKEGAVIKQTSASSGCVCSVTSREHGPRRVVILGTYYQCLSAQNAMWEQMRAASANDSTDFLAEAKVVFMVRKEAAGAVVGKQGANLNAIRDSSQAKIKLDRDEIAGQRPITISGSWQSVMTAEKLIDDIVRGIPVAEESLKRSREDHGAHDGQVAKRPRTDGGSGGGTSQTRLLIPARYAGAVIGKQGQGLKAIRETYDVRVKLLSTEELPAYPGERLVLVTGTLTAKLASLQVMLQAAFAQELDQMLMKLLIPSASAGAIVGKQGSVLKNIRDQTNSNLQLEREEINGERLLHCQGTQLQITSVLQMVLPILENAGSGGGGGSSHHVPPAPPSSTSGQTIDFSQYYAAGAAATMNHGNSGGHHNHHSHQSGSMYGAGYGGQPVGSFAGQQDAMYGGYPQYR
eukprot:TRINITY_DN33977_c0_g1_i1.p1 TRINITY_DN33977_c0_g1~~TRINITY_DN33977_c0_g1_i1.p1  ORF type:complete len:787 (-),score=137.18 TRINITY_DN33977_c0_g1_i1:49-2409(-)